MFSTAQFVLYMIAIVSAGLSVYFSIKSKRTPVGKLRGLYSARLNIAMGIMLVSFAAVQLFLYGSESWIRVGVGFVFLLIGLFNIFAGIRNHSHYNRQE